MKRPTTLLCRVLLNEALQTKLTVERDCVEIRNRFKNEGMSFLTITLPSLDDALIQGLTKGFLTPSMFNGFKPFKRGGKLPAFMAGFFRNVFEDDGWLKETPCIDSIRAIRQVTRLFKKVELPCSSARIKRAYERYVSNDQGISGCPDGRDDVRLYVRTIAGYLWSDLEGISGGLYCSPGIFGSGATAERLAFNERHSIGRWPQRGEESFPASYHTTTNEGDVDVLSGVTFLSEEEEEPARVVQVPKTLKTPRTISVEPSYMMLRQQSIAKPIMDILEQGILGFKSIRFTDQKVNRKLARIGSEDGVLSTIDLSDASDLVSLETVKMIFETCPGFLQYLLDSRTSRALLPDGSQLTLKKFASMGSALCFPIEAMVFFTIALASLSHQSGRSPSRKQLEQLSAKIAVYGDDIIVPTETVDGVMDWLEAFGLRVNHDKSFTKGFFRESCGGDYYKGQDITPSYVRQWSNSINTRNPQYIAACVSLSNQFYMKGLWHASQYIRDAIESQIGKLARTTKPVGCLTWTSKLYNSGLRYDKHRNGYSVRGYQLQAQRRQDPVLDIRAGLLVAFGPSAARDWRRQFVVDSDEHCARLRRIRTDVARLRHTSRVDPPSQCETRSDAEADVSGSRLRDDPHGFGLGAPATAGMHFRPSSEWISTWQVHDNQLGSWEEWLESTKMDWATPPLPRDLSTSVRPYALKLKRRKVPVHNTGLNW